MKKSTFILLLIFPIYLFSQQIKMNFEFGFGTQSYYSDVGSEIESDKVIIKKNNLKYVPICLFLGTNLEYAIDFRSSFTAGIGIDVNAQNTNFEEKYEKIEGNIIRRGVYYEDEHWNNWKLYTPIMYKHKFIYGKRLIGEYQKNSEGKPLGIFYIAVGGAYNKYLSKDKFLEKPLYYVNDNGELQSEPAGNYFKSNSGGLSAICEIGLDDVRGDYNSNTSLYLKYEREFTPRFEIIETGEKFAIENISFGIRLTLN